MTTDHANGSFPEVPRLPDLQGARSGFRSARPRSHAAVPVPAIVPRASLDERGPNMTDSDYQWLRLHDARVIANHANGSGVQ